MASSIAAAPSGPERHFNGISSRFAQGARHLYLSFNQKFRAIQVAYEAGDYLQCASIVEDLRNSQVIKGIASSLSITSAKLSELVHFLRTQLGPFLELVFGAALVAILPAAGGAAIGVAAGVGAGLGTLLGIALILAGILIMLHALLSMERRG